jgi:hypothetical protein
MKVLNDRVMRRRFRLRYGRENCWAEKASELQATLGRADVVGVRIVIDICNVIQIVWVTCSVSIFVAATERTTNVYFAARSAEVCTTTVP